MKKESKIIELSNGVRLELGSHVTGEFHIHQGPPSYEIKTVKNCATMTWQYANGMLELLNQRLGTGEKPWRMPTKEELDEIGKPIRDMFDNNEMGEKERKTKIKEYLKDMGFTKRNYWTSTKDTSTPGFYWALLTSNGMTGPRKEDHELGIRCVREA